MDSDNVMLSPNLLITEEDDSFAILFNQKSGQTYVINPVSVFICRMLDGSNTLADIISAIKAQFVDVPPRKVKKEASAFIEALVNLKLAKAPRAKKVKKKIAAKKKSK